MVGSFCSEAGAKTSAAIRVPSLQIVALRKLIPPGTGYGADCCAEAARAKASNDSQMWLTVMFHVGTGLPWDWRTGPSDSSERDHLLQMIAALPPQALVTADAGFVGYAYWKALLDSGRDLLIRVGANVRLLRNLGYARGKASVIP